MTTERDEYGEYDVDAGSPHPISEDDVSYVPCNAVLKHTFSRYGERRYCTGMASVNFDSEGSQFCKHHRSREALMKQHAENFKTGAYVSDTQDVFAYLEPHEQILANDLYRSLLEESTYNFDAEDTELEIDVADSEFAPDADTLVLSHPVPQNRLMRAKALWFASLDFLTMQSIREEQFRVAFEETFEGEPLAMGERVSVVGVSDEAGAVEDRDEHHLNLALSRIQKDYKRHMEFGGVEYEAADDDGGSTMDGREWVLELHTDSSGAEPEAYSTQNPEPEVMALEDE